MPAALGPWALSIPFPLLLGWLYWQLSAVLGGFWKSWRARIDPLRFWLEPVVGFCLFFVCLFAFQNANLRFALGRLLVLPQGWSQLKLLSSEHPRTVPGGGGTRCPWLPFLPIPGLGAVVSLPSGCPSATAAGGCLRDCSLDIADKCPLPRLCFTTWFV